MKSININIGVGNEKLDEAIQKIKELNEYLEKINTIVYELDKVGINVSVNTTTLSSNHVSTGAFFGSSCH